ncbi:MAG: hypothetical protein RL660_1829, partial [Bacteroidota bacterium]
GGTGTIAITIDSAAILPGYTAGTHTVMATDANGCTATTVVTLTEPPAIIIGDTVTNAACNGGLGSITVNPSGGVGPYSTLINGFAPLSSYPIGNYNITVTDATGCSVSKIVTIIEPNTLVSTITIIDSISCNGDVATLLGTATGGSAPYSFSWNTSMLGDTLAGVGAGTYSLFVVDSLGCTDTTSITLVAPTTVVATISGFTTASCITGFTNGTASVTATGGVAPYVYDWQPGGQTNDTATGLAPGTYTVTVEDVNGCITSTEVTILPQCNDTVYVTPACPTCPVGPICAVVNDVDTTGGATYFACPIAGWTLTGPDVNGCVSYAQIAPVNTPAQGCVITCNNGICDTTIVIINAPITPDTVIVTPACPTCPVVACQVYNDVPFTGSASFSSCGAPSGYTQVGPDAIGCYTYTPNGSVASQVITCQVVCDNGVCDTTYVIINVPQQIINPDFNVTTTNTTVEGNVATNDQATVPGTTYGSPVVWASNPGSAVPTINPLTGEYTFSTSVPGVYNFTVPVCPPSVSTNCPTEVLTITVTEFLSNVIPPYANTDFAWTPIGIPTTLATLANDYPGNYLDTLVASTVTITTQPTNGTATVNPVSGEIAYTPNPSFVGVDTIVYSVCDNSTPAQCATAMQIITIYDSAAIQGNFTIGNDDYQTGLVDSSVTGNARINDVDPHGNSITITAATITNVSGSLSILASGDYTFTPTPGFEGPTEFIYQLCDNGTPVACANATIHILVVPAPALVMPRVLLQGALIVPNVSIMRDNVRAGGYIPVTSPYNASANPRFVNVVPDNETTVASTFAAGSNFNNDIVDWVFLEIRTDTTIGGVLKTVSALLQRDGDVVNKDGKPLYINLPAGNYYLAVKHRNHLGVMTQYPVVPAATVSLIDFSNMAADSLWNRPGYDSVEQVQILGTRYALWAGNANSDNRVKYIGSFNDVSTVQNQVLTYPTNLSGTLNYSLANGYLDGDINLNANAKAVGVGSDVAIIQSNVFNYPKNTTNTLNYGLFLEQLP